LSPGGGAKDGPSRPAFGALLVALFSAAASDTMSLAKHNKPPMATAVGNGVM